jgi:hypothetical protein
MNSNIKGDLGDEYQPILIEHFVYDAYIKKTPRKDIR